MGQVTPAVCQIPISTTDICGVQAIGWCVTCRRRFCLTHQGYYYNSFFQRVSYVDMCVLCSEAGRAADAEREATAWAESPLRYFQEGLAKTALLTAGVPTVEVYRFERRWEPKKGIFTRGGHDVDVVTPIGRGWVLGEFKWQYGDQGQYESKKVVSGWLTALVNEGIYSDSYLASRRPFIRVRPRPPGYERLYTDQDEFIGDWEEARQAVKRLAGLPTP